MHIFRQFALLVFLSTSLLATDIQITEKSGKVRVAKSVGMNPQSLAWDDGGTTAYASWDIIKSFKVKTAEYVKERNAYVYLLEIALTNGKTLTKEVRPLVLSWHDDDGVAYQMTLEKIAAVSVLKTLNCARNEGDRCASLHLRPETLWEHGGRTRLKRAFERVHHTPNISRNYCFTAL